jgi:Pentapeptide repeats (8 copies)
MDRCNELCTKDATGHCAVCEALAERDRFLQFWLKGGFLLDGVRAWRRGRGSACLRHDGWVMARLRDRSTAPRRWWYPVPRTEVRHPDLVREAHKQYAETLNKAMLTLLAVALFCLLTTLGSPDKLLLAADSTIKVPFADAPMSFVAFIVVAPFLLLVVTVYLHIFFGYWLDCERERQAINQSLVGTTALPLESLPTLFALPDAVSRLLTRFIFYWLTPLVLGTMTWKAWALPAMGLPLTYASGVATFALVFLQLRRRPDHQRPRWAHLDATLMVLMGGVMLWATCTPQSFHRPLNLFREELPTAWLLGVNMHQASAGLANFQGADLSMAKLQKADLIMARLQGANLQGANLQKANLQKANLRGANLQKANLQGANLQGANLQGVNFTAVTNLTQDQVNTACCDEDTQLPDGLTRPAPCSAHP